MLRLNTQQKIAVARLAHRVIGMVRRGLGLPMSGEFVRRGLRWQLDLGEGIDFSIFLFGAFEPEVVTFYQKLIPRGGVALDIGANVGAHTLFLAQAVGPGGQVHSFEPTTFAAEKLQRSLALNPELQPRVKLHRLLLAESATAAVPATICSSWPLEKQEGLHEKHLGKSQSTEGTRSATLDEVVEREGLTRIDFVKLDVDGHELPVLRGGAGVWRRFRPPILIELCPHVCIEMGHTFAELIEYLTGLGYRFEELDGRRLPDTAAELERLIPVQGGINVVALCN